MSEANAAVLLAAYAEVRDTLCRTLDKAERGSLSQDEIAAMTARLAAADASIASICSPGAD